MFMGLIQSNGLIDYIKVLRHISTKRVIQCQNRWVHQMMMMISQSPLEKNCHGSTVRELHCVRAFAIRPSLNKMSDKTWYPGCATGRLFSAPLSPMEPRRFLSFYFCEKANFNLYVLLAFASLYQRKDSFLFNLAKTVPEMEETYCVPSEWRHLHRGKSHRHGQCICLGINDYWLIISQSFTAHQHQKGHTVPKQVSPLDDDDDITESTRKKMLWFYWELH